MKMTTPAGSSPEIGPEDWERIARLFSGEADAAEATRTRQWLAASPEYEATVNALATALSQRSQSASIDVESALRKVKSRFEQTPVISLDERRALARRSRVTYLKVAGVSALLLGWGALWQSQRRRQADGEARTFATAIGERREISLSDGSKVVLGPVSTLRFAKATERRSASLTGDAYFSVVHNEKQPFVVRVGATSVRDVGTAFSVRSDEAGGVRVAVDSGSVMVEDSTEAGDGAVLTAGDRANIDSTGLAKIERGTASDDDRSWTQGRLVFRDAPLIEVATALYRWYGVRLRVADSSLAVLHLTASFSGEPIDRVLNVIALSLGASIERQGSVAILRRNVSIPTRR
ncbi:MAG TPA: FecR domain-containing protein [Gemmatimonadaceae bacterium]